jgi:hypothetical protein
LLIRQGWYPAAAQAASTKTFIPLFFRSWRRTFTAVLFTDLVT